MKKFILALMLLTVTGYSKDKWTDVYHMTGDLYRVYDRMTHIVCYVEQGIDQIQCFDVNSDRVGPFKDKKKEKERLKKEIEKLENTLEGYDE